MRKKFWPANAVALGAWEIFAIVAKRPYVSHLVRRAHKANPKTTKAILALWCFSLWRHLILGKDL